MGMEKKIDFNIIDTEISDELGQYLKSGVGVPFSIKGKGIIGFFVYSPTHCRVIFCILKLIIHIFFII